MHWTKDPGRRKPDCGFDPHRLYLSLLSSEAEHAPVKRRVGISKFSVGARDGCNIPKHSIRMDMFQSRMSISTEILSGSLSQKDFVQVRYLVPLAIRETRKVQYCEYEE